MKGFNVSTTLFSQVIPPPPTPTPILKPDCGRFQCLHNCLWSGDTPSPPPLLPVPAWRWLWKVSVFPQLSDQVIPPSPPPTPHPQPCFGYGRFPCFRNCLWSGDPSTYRLWKLSVFPQLSLIRWYLYPPPPPPPTTRLWKVSIFPQLSLIRWSPYDWLWNTDGHCQGHQRQFPAVPSQLPAAGDGRRRQLPSCPAEGSREGSGRVSIRAPVRFRFTTVWGWVWPVSLWHSPHLWILRPRLWSKWVCLKVCGVCFCECVCVFVSVCLWVCVCECVGVRSCVCM